MQSNGSYSASYGLKAKYPETQKKADICIKI